MTENPELESVKFKVAEWKKTYERLRDNASNAGRYYLVSEYQARIDAYDGVLDLIAKQYG